MDTLDRQRARRARVAVTAVFVMHGMLFASWTAHIPTIQRAVGASNGQLGTALLGAPVGSVLAMLLVGKLIPRFGSRVVVRVALVGYGLAGLLVGLAGSLPMLFVGLLVWGAFQGSLDVAMNAHGTEVERVHGGAIMSTFHGFWSIGGLTGALLGAAVVGVGGTLDVQLLPLGTTAVVVTLLLSIWLLPPEHLAAVHQEAASRAAASRKPGRRGLPKAALLLGGVAFASMLCEGATADWSAVHLRTDLGAPAAIAGLGYAGYACSMVIVRLSAARIFSRVAPARIIPVLALIASAGMVIGLLSHSTVVSLIGYAALGIGLATVVPTAFSAASRIPGGKPGQYIALVAALGWAGFVCGPPIIGHLSEVTGLPLALGLVPLLAAAVAVAIRLGRLFPATPSSAGGSAAVSAAGPASSASSTAISAETEAAVTEER